MKGIELVVKNILTNRKPSSNGFFTEFYPIFKEEIVQILSNMDRILKRKKCFLYQFLRQTLPIYKKKKKTDTTKIEYYQAASVMKIDIKLLNKI